MSLPTRIFLAAALVFVAALGTFSHQQFSAASEDRPFASQLGELEGDSERAGQCRGQVSLAGVTLFPEEALVIHVLALSERTGVAVEDSVAVEPDGTFECFGLPIGVADLRLELASGEIPWEAEGVSIDAMGTRDLRVSEIELTGLVWSVELFVLGPEDEPVEAGRLAWRHAAGSTEDVTLANVASIKDGRAQILTTDPTIDAMCLVPGADPELFHGVGDGSELLLGPGTTVRLDARGQRPDHDRWRVHAILHPLELEDGFNAMVGEELRIGGTVAGLVDAEGRADVPVTFAGTYDLRWYVEEARQGVSRGYRVEGGHGPVRIEPRQGQVPIEVEFPMNAFLRSLDSR